MANQLPQLFKSLRTAKLKSQRVVNLSHSRLNTILDFERKAT